MRAIRNKLLAILAIFCLLAVGMGFLVMPKTTMAAQVPQSNFYIEGGSNPISDDRAYGSDVISTLINAYKAHDVELQNATVTKAPAANSAPVNNAAPVVTKRQTSLI